MRAVSSNKPQGGWRRIVYEVIFESDARAGQWFDILLIVSILLNVIVIMIESVGPIRAQHGPLLLVIAWFFTILFTVEYVLRLRRFTEEAASLSTSPYASRWKIAVFLLTVLTLVIVIGALMYIVEGAESGCFTSFSMTEGWLPPHRTAPHTAIRAVLSY